MCCLKGSLHGLFVFIDLQWCCLFNKGFTDWLDDFHEDISRIVIFFMNDLVEWFPSGKTNLSPCWFSIS